MLVAKKVRHPRMQFRLINRSFVKWIDFVQNYTKTRGHFFKHHRVRVLVLFKCTVSKLTQTIKADISHCGSNYKIKILNK